MSKQWTPRTFVKHRRWRVAIAALATFASCATAFVGTTRKAIALEVNGKTQQVVTYASSLQEFLNEQGIDLKTHDQAISSSGEWLSDHAVVKVREAFQVTLNIDGHQIPYWTVAKSASQLASYFDNAHKDAVKITVNIANVYQQLTGGVVIDKPGPVTVIWDGKESVAPDGRLPVASILDSKGITLNKDDRVSVENGTDSTGKQVTILRVQRITFGEITRTIAIPFSTVKVEDSNLEEGVQQVRQAGADGSKAERLRVTYVDGVADQYQLLDSTVTSQPTDEIIAVGTKKPTPPASDSSDSGNAGNAADSGSTGSDSSKGSSDQGQKGNSDSSDNSGDKGNSGNSSSGNDSNQGGNNGGNSGNSGNSGNNGGNGGNGNSGNNGSQPDKPSNPPDNGGNNGGNNSGNSGNVLHLSPAEAQSLARGMARDFYGWGDDQFACLLTLWNHESGWRWDADNPYSDAYGIPQALPGWKMGEGWHDNAQVQISWGLGYIRGRYTNPCGAWDFWQRKKWY